jgi:GntR family transcriptional regulator of vanillate catabolism
LGVSRTPIRLALEQLAHEGLLEPRATGGFVIRAFSFHDVCEANEMRSVLEGTAARLAAERLARDSDLDVLREYQAQMDAIVRPTLDTFPQYIELNTAFHAEIVRLAHSDMLRWTLDRILALPFAGPSALVFARAKLPHGYEIYPLAREHHRAVIEAIANRQGSRAESIAREHTRLARRNLETALTDQDFLSDVPGRVLIRTEISVDSRFADKSGKRSATGGI